MASGRPRLPLAERLHATFPGRPRARSRRRSSPPSLGCGAVRATTRAPPSTTSSPPPGSPRTEGLIESSSDLGAAHLHRPGGGAADAWPADRGIRVGVLSNTMWPRSAHERVFLRDQVLDLIDGAVYSSEIPWIKPHPEAFRAAMAAVGVHDPAPVCSSATAPSTTCTAPRARACGRSWFPTATCPRSTPRFPTPSSPD